MALNRTSKQIIITSAAKNYTKATKTGKLNMDVIALYNMVAYYANFAKGKEEYNKKYSFLLNLLTKIKYKNPEVICNYKSVSPSYTVNTDNTAPSTADRVIDLEDTNFYEFTLSDFAFSYSDPQNQGYKFLLINPDISNKGNLKLNGVTITLPQIINIENLPLSSTLNLVFERTDLSVFALEDIFTFRISDNDDNYLYSSLYTVQMLASLVSSSNLAAAIGDNVIYPDNRSTTVLTLEMFTSQLAPPYSDPENDLIDAIRIDEISTANLGQFIFNGVEIQVGDIITREDLLAGLFIHIGPDQDSISSDVINFSARDEGSLIWVQ